MVYYLNKHDSLLITHTGLPISDSTKNAIEDEMFFIFHFHDLFGDFLTFGSCWPNWLHGKARISNFPEAARTFLSLIRDL